jgi:flavin reductase
LSLNKRSDSGAPATSIGSVAAHRTHATLAFCNNDLLEDKKMEKDGFKAAMRRLAGGVCVITTFDDGLPFGFTSTAVSSVTADPPTLLVGVNQSARTHEAIKHSGAFAVNFLAMEQSNVSAIFASKSPNKFENMPYRMVQGCPILRGTCGYVVCKVSGSFVEGSHTLFLGRLLESSVASGLPLIYHEGQYGKFATI